MVAADTKPGGIRSPAPSTHEVFVSWKQVIHPIEPFLQAVANRLGDQVEAFDPEIASYARYALTNQGKQLRPVLVALSGSATGKLNDDLVTVAVVIEMVHLATLVHDDVMDHAEIRRRRPTVAANWGNQLSVLLGDCLFAQAVKLSAGFPTPDVCRAVAVATNRVCAGEILQTQHRRDFEFSRAAYFKILEMKTAELFALSCELGASMAGAKEVERAAMREYGLALGTAYQIYDDCLDLFGSEAAAGKSLGTDLASGKLTLPLLVVLERGSVEDQAELRRLIENWDAQFFPCVIELLERYDVQTESRSMIHQYLDHARQAVDLLPKSQGRMALLALTDFLAQQTESLGVPT